MKTVNRILGVVALALALAPAAPAARSALEAQTPKHNCSFCHNLHGGSYAALADSATSQALCQGCHGDAGPAQWNRDGTMVDIPKQQAIHNGSKHTAPTSCWDCHDHEGSASGNLFMIPRTKTIQGVDTTIIFTSDATQAGFTGVNGVCYVCHTQAGPKANGLSGHNGPDVCTFCHTHDAGFQGAGGSCTSCHNSPRGNHREVVSEFDRSSHHIQLGGAGADIPEADCQVCHDQNGHPRAGTDHVVLINQDNGTTINYDPGVTDPSVLTPFCLSCHDIDGGAGGDTSPFSDGIVRPLINEAAWTASTHATSTNADCADCHEVHGSQKVKLLTPGSVTPNATTKVEEQEGFCFQCHDGTPASNIQSQFANAIRWVQDPVGLNANPNLNDRHDVQHDAQTRSGAKIECVNCHNPHTASAQLPYILDPDPSDGHVPGTNYYYYAASADTLSEFCLDCHDGSFPAGVLDHTGGSPAGLVNIRVTQGIDGMGARKTSSLDAEPGTGWDNAQADSARTGILGCGVCHRPHPEADADRGATNLFAAVDTVRSPTGTPLQGYSARRTQTLSYGFSTIAGLEQDNGATFCMTCHNRVAMLGQRNCFLSCHRHGDGGRW